MCNIDHAKRLFLKNIKHLTITLISKFDDNLCERYNLITAKANFSVNSTVRPLQSSLSTPPTTPPLRCSLPRGYLHSRRKSLCLNATLSSLLACRESPPRRTGTGTKGDGPQDTNLQAHCMQGMIEDLYSLRFDTRFR